MRVKLLSCLAKLLVAFLALPCLFGDSVGAESAQPSGAWAFSPEALLWLIFVLCVLVAVLAIYIIVKSFRDKHRLTFNSGN
jgi:predicted permease